MAESRQELLGWVNQMLQLNFTKIEQLGSGAAYCQVMDSIYGNIPLSKVKFNSKGDYESIQNYKILQNCFNANKIDKVIPVERLMKNRFQDNFEFLQWLRRFWEQYCPGGNYDAVNRRRGQVVEVPGAERAPSRTTRGVPAGRAPSATGSAGSRGGMADPKTATLIQDLNKQITELKVNIDGVEKERDFYFNKLRSVEIYLQQLEGEFTENETVLVREIQAILYSTEDGFEPDTAEDQELSLINDQMHHVGVVDDDETF
ncbi:EB1 domain-containing protein [Dimargaris cristalligena]|uniref:EB1 domain-containing protein n=1 Tax=Dimargaris cristalligena TaxID=215637 RepID=A0A4P9ZP28_9FUNG|nr:EB1 domain-containing protein [Dimargaris cristalligena]|eukprot:RKP34938.1 EB1 domain-containing protein [Dimargaris cristalligena]